MANQFSLSRRGGRRRIIWAIFVLILASLACSLGQGEAQKVQIRTLSQLTPTTESVLVAEVPTESPPETPTPTPNATVDLTATYQAYAQSLVPTRTPLPTKTSTPISKSGSSQQTANDTSPTSTPIVTPTPTVALILPPSSANPTPTPLPELQPTPPPPPAASPPPLEPPSELPPGVPGWSFVGIRSTYQGSDTVVVGELVNNTGSTQTEVYVSGTFYDKHDKAIVDKIEDLSYVAAEIIPVGASVPFELFIESLEPVYRLDLYAMSTTINDTPRQDFLISNINQWTDSLNRYCVGGDVQNAGNPLADYLIILASTYNTRGQLASFGEYSVRSPDLLIGDEKSAFEMCIDPLDQQIVYHELNAIGY